MALKTLFSTGIFLIVFSVACFAQSSDKITPPEYIEANEFSHKFADQLFKTKDIEPLLKEYFVEDFIERSLHNNYESALSFLTKDEIPKNRTSKFKRFYIGQMNFFLLVMVRAYSSPDIDIEKMGDDPALFFPRQVRSQLKRKPYFKSLFKRFDGNRIESKLANEYEKEKLFDNYLLLLERLNRILRNSTSKTRLENSKGWKESFKFIDEYMSAYKPRKESCDDNCYDLAKGTRLIHVNIPFFHLTLTKLDGKLRLLNFQSYFN